MAFSSPAQALAVLGLTTNATREDVKSSYHKLVALYHPDANGTETASEKYFQITEAYEFLSAAFDAAEQAAVREAQAAAARSGYPNAAPMWTQSRSVIRGTNTAEGSARPVGEGRASRVNASEILGSKENISRQKARRAFKEQHAKQELRAAKRAKEEKKRRLAEQSRYEANRAYEEAMAKIRAIRAAEISASIIEAALAGKL